jgi:hypothetical protein
VFGRSDTSFQNKLLRQFTKQSQFNVLITGTLFPLGPSHDAIHVLTSMAGDFQAGNWGQNPPLRLALDRIFSHSSLKLRRFPLLPLRVLIAPFILRRTASSTWKGDFIIKRTITRPSPRVITPAPDNYTSRAHVQFKRNMHSGDKKSSGKETEYQRMERADAMRLYAWSPLYQVFKDSVHDAEKVAAEKRVKVNVQKIMERVIRCGLAGDDFARTSRMEALISLVKEIRRKGERFIIVTERIFLVTLAYWVFTFIQIASDSI